MEEHGMRYLGIIFNTVKENPADEGENGECGTWQEGPCEGDLPEFWNMTSGPSRKHQEGDTECGVYTIWFLSSRLHGCSLAELHETRFPDEAAHALRKTYFGNPGGLCLRGPSGVPPEKHIVDAVKRRALDESDNPDNPDKPDKPDKPDRPDKPGKPDKPDKPDNPDKTGKPEKPDIPDKADKPGKPYKPDKPDNPDKADKPGKPYKPYKPDKPDKPDKPGKPYKPDNPDKADKNSQSEDNLLKLELMAYADGMQAQQQDHLDSSMLKAVQATNVHVRRTIEHGGVVPLRDSLAFYLAMCEVGVATYGPMADLVTFFRRLWSYVLELPDNGGLAGPFVELVRSTVGLARRNTRVCRACKTVSTSQEDSPGAFTVSTPEGQSNAQLVDLMDAEMNSDTLISKWCRNCSPHTNVPHDEYTSVVGNEPRVLVVHLKRHLQSRCTVSYSTEGLELSRLNRDFTSSYQLASIVFFDPTRRHYTAAGRMGLGWIYHDNDHVDVYVDKLPKLDQAILLFYVSRPSPDQCRIARPLQWHANNCYQNALITAAGYACLALSSQRQ